MASTSSKHTLVDTVDKAEEAIKVLKGYTLLSVDCEGVDLGRDGELCLLQVAIPDKVYLFDIVVLKEKIFDSGLKSILEDQSITKLFYDCREDCSALTHQYSVNVQGMEDMQLLNSLNMKLSGRASPYVSGLQKAVSYHLIGCGFSGPEKEKMHKALDNDRTLWRKRPLSEDFMRYAATDVLYLSRLRDKIHSRLSAHGTPEDLSKVVKYASTRYADFMRHNTKYKRDSPYFRTARLPEKIIPEITRTGSRCDYKPFSNTVGRTCKTCNWMTEINLNSDQCNRCYLIDNPTGSNRQFQPPAKRRRIL